MKRLVLAGCLIAAVTGGAAAAFVEAAAPSADHRVCVVLAKDKRGDNTQDLCVTYPNLPQQS